MSVEVIEYGDVPKAVSEGNENALIEIANAVTNTATALAPVDTGQLRNSIMWEVKGADGGFNDGSGKTPAERKLSKNPKDGEAYVGSALLHSIYNEFGTRRMAAQPFLRPAITEETSGTRAVRTIKKLQEESVANGMKKGPRKKKVIK